MPTKRDVLILGANGQAAAEHIFVAEKHELVGKMHTWDILDKTPMPQVDTNALVVIATPTHTHYEVALPWLERGNPILVEKPLCLHYETLKKFLEWEAKGAWIMVGQNKRFTPGARFLKKICAESPVLLGHTWKMRSRDSGYYRGGIHGMWATDGGVLSQQAQHNVDLVCWLMGGSPRHIGGSADQRQHQHVEAEDTVAIQMIYPCGALWTLTGTTAMKSSLQSNEGIMVTTRDYNGGYTGYSLSKSMAGDKVDGAPLEVCHVALSLLAEDKLSPVPAQEALWSVDTINRFYTSMGVTTFGDAELTYAI